MDADQPAPGHGRKLASIVSIDIAGYSHLAEENEAAALRAVSTVRGRINRSAEVHRGRVFSSAGDGFMLEFPTASEAVAAAEEIASGEGPRVRVGVHVGEVFLTESGDMLGHGVNIAARIQHLAAVGGVLVSGDVKRAVRGELGARLTLRGDVKLDKMDETMPVFQLGSVASPARRRPRIDWRWLGAAALAISLLGLAASFMNQTSAQPTRIAVLPFRTLGQTATLTTLSGGLADRLVAALSERRMLTVSPDDALALRGANAESRRAELGVRLLIDGSVEGDENITVDARVEDARNHSVLWSVELQGAAADTQALQARVAARIVAELYCASRALAPSGGLSDPTALSAYLRACDLFLVHSDDSELTYQLLASLRQVTAAAPRFSAAHSDIAKYQAYFLDQFPVDQVASLRQDIETEAQRALALDPRNADAYVARYLLLPSGRWGEGERILRQGLALDSDWPHANGFLGNLLTQVGRVHEASLHYQRASAANPMSGGLSWSSQNAIGLDNIGRSDLANQSLAEITRLWASDDSDGWRARLQILVSQRRWDNALALLTQRDAIPKWFSPSNISMNRDFFLAARSRDRHRIETERQALIAFAAHGGSSLPIRALTALGFKDDAFAIIARLSDADLVNSPLPYYLFTPPLAPLRHDPRFMTVAARMGLIDYWRTAGVQPDFCAEPDLPYNCVAQEQLARPQAH